MNTIASSFQCRALRHPLKSIVLRKKSLHLWSHKSNSMVSLRLASTDAKSGILSKLRKIFKPNSDKRASKSATSTSLMDPEKYYWSLMSRKGNKRNSSDSKKVTELSTDRVQTIHPDIEPPERDVVDNLTPKDQASKLVENLQFVNVKASNLIYSEDNSVDLETIKQRRRQELNIRMDKEKDEALDSPETITRRIEGHIVRGALDEERRARKALILLQSRDRKIAILERKIAEYEKQSGGNYHSPEINSSQETFSSNTSFKSVGRETSYLSLPPTEAPDSSKRRTEITENNENLNEQRKALQTSSIPFLKLPTTSVSSSENNAVILKDANSDFGDSSSTTENYRHEMSSIDLVMTAALAFSKFNENQRRDNHSALVSGDGHVINEATTKKMQMESKDFISPRTSPSPSWMKTRRGMSRRYWKRRVEKKIGKTRGSNVLTRNLEMVQAGLDALLSKNRRGRTENSSIHGTEEEVEDKVVQQDAQEAASTLLIARKTVSTQTYTNFNTEFSDPRIITSELGGISSEHFFSEYKRNSKSWNESDEPAPQWLIEAALNRGKKFRKNDRLHKSEGNRDENEDIIAMKLNHENIIFELEKQLCATKSELSEALNEQMIIKNKYKKALKTVKIAADEERDELQQKLVKICTTIIDKFGPNALNSTRLKPKFKKYHKPLQHFGKLTRKLHRKLRIATLTSAKLKQEVLSARNDLIEKTHQYDSMVKSFANLKEELNNTKINLNDLINENVSLRKRIDDAREWMQMRAGKERNERINAAQFRDIQRSRELTNLKKKSEEDFSTIAQLRGKLLRSEAANSNKGFLLNNYKSQLAELSKEKNNLSAHIKELENENSLLRNSNAQLKASVTLINDEKEKIATVSEKSEIDLKERMETQLATKYERTMLQKIDMMKENYDKAVKAIESKLKSAEYLAMQYFQAIKFFLKEIHDYRQELDAERELNCSEASEREAHETACTILNITPGELTNFLRGRPSNTINSWLTDVEKIISKKSFAEDLGNFLFARTIGSIKN